jgi:hypothetical protein
MNDADWEALKLYADKLERIVAALAKERERRKIPVPAQRGKQHTSPTPAQATAGFLLAADEPNRPKGQGRR